MPQLGKCEENPKHCTVSSVAPHGSTRPCKIVLIFKLILFWQCASPTDFLWRNTCMLVCSKRRKSLLVPHIVFYEIGPLKIPWEKLSGEYTVKLKPGVFFNLFLLLCIIYGLWFELTRYHPVCDVLLWNNNNQKKHIRHRAKKMCMLIINYNKLTQEP